MTSRYALYEIDKLRDRFNIEKGLPKGVKPHYNISPTQTVPVVINKNGVNQIEFMKWGVLPTGAKDDNSIFRYKTYNARSETVFNKPTWITAIRERRCIIPANGFYEWKTTLKGKKPFIIQTTDQSLFSLAGLYNEWTDLNGNIQKMCSIITIDSETPDDMTPSRLPVIIQPSDEKIWLNPVINDMSSIYSVMQPYDLKNIKITSVSPDVNSIKIDKPYLINHFKTS